MWKKYLATWKALTAAEEVVWNDLGYVFGETGDAATPSPVAPAATPVAARPFPVGFVSARQASDYVGQVATVCGTVATANYMDTLSGAPTFLKLDEPYPGQVFTILMWGWFVGKPSYDEGRRVWEQYAFDPSSGLGRVSARGSGRLRRRPRSRSPASGPAACG